MPAAMAQMKPQPTSTSAERLESVRTITRAFSRTLRRPFGGGAREEAVEPVPLRIQRGHPGWCAPGVHEDPSRAKTPTNRPTGCSRKTIARLT